MSQVSMQLLAASTTTIVVLVVGIIVSLVALAVFAQFFGLWLQAYMSKASVSIGDLIGMKLRKVNIGTIVRAKIQLVKAGIHEVSTNDLESHYLAGGRVINLSQSLISANRAQIELNWKTGAAIDLAGRDVLDAVHTSVNPKVIDVPGEQSGKRTIDAVSKDGIQLKARARVTVRTNISQLIGGATDETVIARVGEGIVSAIGSADTHKAVLENPDRISKAVLARGLDSGTAYEILSIDIADIDVGVNIGAQLQADQAEADAKTRCGADFCVLEVGSIGQIGTFLGGSEVGSDLTPNLESEGRADHEVERDGASRDQWYTEVDRYFDVLEVQ